MNKSLLTFFLFFLLSSLSWGSSLDLDSFYHDGELRWVHESPNFFYLEKKITPKRKKIKGKVYYELEKDYEAWVVLPKSSLLRIVCDESSAKALEKNRYNLLFVGNTTKVFQRKDLQLGPSKQEYFLYPNLFETRIVRIKAPQKLHLRFQTSFSKPISKGEAFRDTEPAAQQKDLNKAPYIRSRDYQVKDSERFYYADYEHPLVFDSDEEEANRFVFKMKMFAKSNKDIYSNWIEVHLDDVFYENYFFDVSAIDNQLNYLHNQDKVFTQDVIRWFKEAKKISFKPLLPIYIKKVKPDHRSFFHFDFEQKFDLLHSFQEQQQFLDEIKKESKKALPYKTPLPHLSTLRRSRLSKNLEFNLSETHSLLIGKYGSYRQVYPESTQNSKYQWLSLSPRTKEHPQRVALQKLIYEKYLLKLPEPRPLLFTEIKPGLKFLLEKNKRKTLRIFYLGHATKEILLRLFDQNNKEINSFFIKDVPSDISLKTRMSVSEIAVKFKAKRFHNRDASILSDRSDLILNANLEDIGFIEFDVPARVSEISFKETLPAQIALQSFDAKAKPLSLEKSLISKKLGVSPLSLFQEALKSCLIEKDIKRSMSVEQDFVFHFKEELCPLVEELKYQHDLELISLNAAVEPYISEKQSQVLFDRFQKKKIKMEDLEKLSYFSKLSFSKSDKIRSWAVLEKALLLKKLHLNAVFERYIRKHLMFVSDLKIKAQVYDLLLNYYEETGQIDKAVRHMSSEVYKSPKELEIKKLIGVLNKKGKFKQARSFSLLLTDREGNSDQLESSIRSSDEELYDYFVRKQKTQVSPYLQKWSHFKFEHRLKKKDQKKERKILRRLRSKRLRQREIEDWISLHKSQKRHENAFKPTKERFFNKKPSLIRAETLMKKDILFKESKNKSLKFKLLGPMDYKFQVRPQHAKGAKSPLSDWLTVKAFKTDFKWPVLENKKSETIKINSRTQSLGDAVSFVVSVPKGLHDVELSAEKSDFFLDVQEAFDARKPMTLPRLSVNLVEQLTSYPESQFCDQVSVGKSKFLGNTSGNFKHLTPFYTLNHSVFCKKSSTLFLAKEFKKYISENKNSISIKVMPLDFYYSKLSEEDLKKVFKMIELLYSYTKKRRHVDLLEAEHMYQMENASLQVYLRPFWVEMRKYGEWSKFENAVSNNGIWIDDNIKSKEESYESKLNRALCGALDQESNLLRSGYSLSYAIKTYKRKRLQIQLRLAEPSELKMIPLKVEIGFKGSNFKPQTVWLSKEKPLRYINLTSESGESYLYIKNQMAARGQVVVVNVKELNLNQRAVPLDLEQERTYHITSKYRPIKVLLQGPELIRYEYRGQKTKPYYIFIKKGLKHVSLPPETGKSKSYLRIFNYKRKNKIQYKERVKVYEHRGSPVVPLKDLKPVKNKLQFNENLDLNYQSFGTLTTYASYVARILAEEPLGGFIDNENYVEFGETYRRHFKTQSLYLRTSLFTRLRQFGQPVYGNENRLTTNWHPLIGMPPLSVWFVNKNFYQAFEERGIAFDTWSRHNSLSIAQHRQFWTYITHYPQITFFHRYQKLNSLERINRIYIDQDVFSNYKEDHRWGVSLSDQWTWHFFWNSFLRFKIKYVTNEELSDHEYWRWQWSYTHYFKYVEAGVTYADLRFLDKDVQSVRNNWASAYILFNKWVSNQNRFEFRLDFSRSIEARKNNYAFSVQYHFGRGRSYNDFYPGERNFKGLKQRLAPKYNLIKYE